MAEIKIEGKKAKGFTTYRVYVNNSMNGYITGKKGSVGFHCTDSLYRLKAGELRAIANSIDEIEKVKRHKRKKPDPVTNKLPVHSEKG